jgi:hypothetical protein
MFANGNEPRASGERGGQQGSRGGGAMARWRGHKSGATVIVLKGLARPGLKIEIEAVAAKAD